MAPDLQPAGDTNSMGRAGIHSSGLSASLPRGLAAEMLHEIIKYVQPDYKDVLSLASTNKVMLNFMDNHIRLSTVRMDIQRADELYTLSFRPSTGSCVRRLLLSSEGFSDGYWEAPRDVDWSLEDISETTLKALFELSCTDSLHIPGDGLASWTATLPKAIPHLVNLQEVRICVDFLQFQHLGPFFQTLSTIRSLAIRLKGKRPGTWRFQEFDRLAQVITRLPGGYREFSWTSISLPRTNQALWNALVSCLRLRCPDLETLDIINGGHPWAPNAFWNSRWPNLRRLRCCGVLTGTQPVNGGTQPNGSPFFKFLCYHDSLESLTLGVTESSSDSDIPITETGRFLPHLGFLKLRISGDSASDRLDRLFAAILQSDTRRRPLHTVYLPVEILRRKHMTWFEDICHHLGKANTVQTMGFLGFQDPAHPVSRRIDTYASLRMLGSYAKSIDTLVIDPHVLPGTDNLSFGPEPQNPWCRTLQRFGCLHHLRAENGYFARNLVNWTHAHIHPARDEFTGALLDFVSHTKWIRGKLEAACPSLKFIDNKSILESLAEAEVKSAEASQSPQLLTCGDEEGIYVLVVFFFPRLVSLTAELSDEHMYNNRNLCSHVLLFVPVTVLP